MSTNVSFSNKSFQRTVKSVRKVMPILAVILLIVVYLISAVAEGVFLANLMQGFTGAVWLAYGMSGAIQATRALLVFFPQLNPNRPTFGYQGEAIAVVMGLVAIGSVWGIVYAVGLPHPVGISLSILMLAGMGVEIFFLREIRYATELELFSNREHWEEIREYHQSRAELKAFLDSLLDYEASQPVSQPAQQKSTTTFSAKVLNALGMAYQITDQQMDTIRNLINNRSDEDDIIMIIKSYSMENIAANKLQPNSEVDKIIYFNGGQPLTETDLYFFFNDYKNGKLPEKTLTDQQKDQIMQASKNAGIKIDPDFLSPLEVSLNGNGNGSH